MLRASKSQTSSGLLLHGWRRGRDSNPRYGCPYAAFRVRCIQPLCHLSACARPWLNGGRDSMGGELPQASPWQRFAGAKPPARASPRWVCVDIARGRAYMAGSRAGGSSARFALRRLSRRVPEAGTARSRPRLQGRRAGSNTRTRTMFAVIKTGGKQYRVAAEDVITIAKLDAQPGESVTFGEVLMFTNDNGTELGLPTVAGEVVEQTRGRKVIAFKKRRRQNSKRKRGHRQDFTVVRITEILTGGAKPAPVEAAPEPAAAEAAPAAPDAEVAKKPRAPRKKKAESGEPTAE